jgi:PAS domain S-box-containing protein
MISICLDTAGRVSQWNSAAEDMSGFKRDEVSKLDFFNTLLEIDTKIQIHDQFLKAWAGETVSNLELPFYTKCGRRVELVLSLSLCLPEGLVLTGGVAALEEDIPMEDKVVETTISVDSSGYIIGWEDEMELALGFSRAEVTGLKFVDDILVSEDRVFAGQKFKQALLGERVPSFELPIYSKSAYLKCFNVHIVPHYIDDEVTGAIFVLAGDHVNHACKTQASEAEQTWTQEQFPSYESISTCSESQLPEIGFDIVEMQQGGTQSKTNLSFSTCATLGDLDSVSKFSVDTEGYISDWDDGVAVLLEFCRDEVLGLSFIEEILTVDVRALASQNLRQALLGEHVPNFELPIYSRSAKRKSCNVSINPCYIGEELVGAIFVLGGEHVNLAWKILASKGDHHWKQEQFPSYDSLLEFPTIDLKKNELHQTETQAGGCGILSVNTTLEDLDAVFPVTSGHGLPDDSSEI